MIKEVIISIIIVISIFSLDVITQNFTEESTHETGRMLLELKDNIKGKNSNIPELLEEIFDNWNKRKETLAYFIEHDELEKVETNLTNIKSFVEVEDLDMAISSIEEAEFILQHIEEKNRFNLKNIF